MQLFHGSLIFLIAALWSEVVGKATPSLRKKGLGGQLIWEVMTLFHDRDGSPVFYLLSGIDPKLYEKLDFLRLPEKHQLKPGTTTMIRCRKDLYYLKR